MGRTDVRYTFGNHYILGCLKTPLEPKRKGQLSSLVILPLLLSGMFIRKLISPAKEDIMLHYWCKSSTIIAHAAKSFVLL